MNKNYFKKWSRKYLWVMLFTVFVAVALYPFVSFLGFKEDDIVYKILDELYMPVFLALFGILGTKWASLQDTHKMHKETEYKHKKGLISDEEYEKRINDLIEIENEDSTFKVPYLILNKEKDTSKTD